MRYKIGDYVLWYDTKCKVVKDWGDSVVTGDQVISIRKSNNFITTERVSNVKQIMKVKAELGDKV